MTLQAVVSLLQMVLTLLTVVQSNPALPQSVRDTAFSIAQHAVVVATQSLNQTSTPASVQSPTGSGTSYGQAGGGGSITTNSDNTDNGDTASSVDVTQPTWDAVLTQGTQYTITWDSSSDMISQYPNVDLVLVGMTNSTCDPYGCGVNNPMNGSMLAAAGGTSLPTKLVIASNVSLASGAYTWSIPSNLSTQISTQGGKYKLYFLRAGTQTRVLPFTDVQFTIR